MQGKRLYIYSHSQKSKENRISRNKPNQGGEGPLQWRPETSQERDKDTQKWKDIPNLRIVRINGVKITTPPKGTKRFISIPSKISISSSEK